MGLLQKFFGKDRVPPDQTEEIFRRHLDRDFRAFPMAESTATPLELQALGTRLCISFPCEFVSHVCGRFPGVYVEVKEEVWPRPKAYDVGPFWSFLYGLHTFTPCSSSEDWMRLDFVAERFQKNTGYKCAPVLQIIGDADVYCVDSSGALVRYDHESNALIPEADDFWVIFEREVEQLKNRKMQKITDA